MKGIWGYRDMGREGGKNSNSNIGLVLVSQNCRVLGVNKQALQLLNIDNSCLGKSLSHNLHPAAQAWINELIMHNCRERREFSSSIRASILDKNLIVTLSTVESYMEEMPVFAVTLVDGPGQCGSASEKKRGCEGDGKIRIYSEGVHRLVDIRSIYSIKSEGNYCTVFTEDRRYFARMTLKRVLGGHDAGPLFQVHKSHLVNLDYVSGIKMSKKGGRLVVFRSPLVPSVPVAKRKLMVLKDMLSRRNG